MNIKSHFISIPELTQLCLIALKDKCCKYTFKNDKIAGANKMAYQLRGCMVLAENPGQAASNHLELSSRDLTLYSGSYDYQPSHMGCLSKET